MSNQHEKMSHNCDNMSAIEFIDSLFSYEHFSIKLFILLTWLLYLTNNYVSQIKTTVGKKITIT